MTAPRWKLMFVTGTRADFGKLKPLIRAVDQSPIFDCHVFVTGMHTLDLYGYTVCEVQAENFKNVHVFINQFLGEPMDLVLGNTIAGMSRYVHEARPDMIIVHGDRIEALAGAAVGALRNILVTHIEGGELSGTVDELIRHSVSKLSHLHFVANDEAARRLRQLGEDEGSIFVIGSPDIDVMASPDLPTLDTVRSRYEIQYSDYALAIFHPVTTEAGSMRAQTRAFVDALLASGHNYVVIYPNNDEGSGIILTEYARLQDDSRFRLVPSIRFEYFLTLLKNASFIVGNSSVGIREAPFYAVPSVNVGTRQANRFSGPSIVNVKADRQAILDGIDAALALTDVVPTTHFGAGDGDSLVRFMRILCNQATWLVSPQKQFRDLDLQLNPS